jgi:hypothetical protein
MAQCGLGFIKASDHGMVDSDLLYNMQAQVVKVIERTDHVPKL